MYIVKTNDYSHFLPSRVKVRGAVGETSASIFNVRPKISNHLYTFDGAPIGRLGN